MENKLIRKTSNFGSLMLLIFSALTFIFSIATSLLMYAGIIDVYSDLYYFTAYSYQFIFAGSLSLLIFYLIRRRDTGLSVKRLFCKPQMPAGWIVKWIIIGISMTYLANLVNLAFEAFLQYGLGMELPEFDLNFGSDSPFAKFTMVFSLSVLAPFFEELIFRGTVLRNNEILGQKFAIFSSALFFGLYHMNHSQIFYAFILGLFSGFLFVKTRSIIPSMITHFIINTVSSVTMAVNFGSELSASELIAKLSTDPGSLMPAVFAGLLIYAFVITGIVLIIAEFAKKKNRQNLRLRKSIFSVSAGKKALVYYTAPLTALLIVYLLVMTVLNTVMYNRL